jgi:hypothetical protein
LIRIKLDSKYLNETFLYKNDYKIGPKKSQFSN